MYIYNIYIYTPLAAGTSHRTYAVLLSQWKRIGWRLVNTLYGVDCLACHVRLLRVSAVILVRGLSLTLEVGNGWFFGFRWWRRPGSAINYLSSTTCFSNKINQSIYQQFSRNTSWINRSSSIIKWFGIFMMFFLNPRLSIYDVWWLLRTFKLHQVPRLVRHHRPQHSEEVVQHHPVVQHPVAVLKAWS